MSHAKHLAIVGLACAFPGARTAQTFWQNLLDGTCSIAQLSEAEMLADGADPSALGSSHYVRHWGALEDVDLFDAAFFGIPSAEAETMDPQHRIFLEVAHAALEDAGCCPASYDGLIGVYAGVGPNTYLMRHLLPNLDRLGGVDELELFINNDKDFVPTRLSYKLDLRGPSHTVNAGCSSALIALHQACMALKMYQADAALAGGINISLPQKKGYVYRRGGVLSANGQVRPFDAAASGTVFGNGAGVVLIKRAEEALAEGDHIYALIRATAINNDGAAKAGFTAPSVSGQVDVVATAQALAGASAGDIGYLEAHGTGTQLGDPVELKALHKVFGDLPPNHCYLGSVKANLGHLDIASGMPGLIKTILCLQHGKIPGQIHFDGPGPELGLERGPFTINTTTVDWPERNGTRLAGVSSFGVGGTNVHVILEQAPARPTRPTPAGPQLLLLSARTAEALSALRLELAAFLRQHPDLELADVVHTLMFGRRFHEVREALVVDHLAEAVTRLSQEPDGSQASSGVSALHELARRWVAGEELDFSTQLGDRPGRKLALPTYPFQRQRFWIDPPAATAPTTRTLSKEPLLHDWFHVPSWVEQPLLVCEPDPSDNYLLFRDGLGVADLVAQRLRGLGLAVVTVDAAASFAQTGDHFCFDQNDPQGLDQVLTLLKQQGRTPSRVLHFGNLASAAADHEALLETAFYQLLNEIRQLGKSLHNHQPHLLMLTSQLFQVSGDEPVLPAKTTLLGPLRVLSQEQPGFTASVLDLVLPDAALDRDHPFLDALVAECLGPPALEPVALRGRKRWERCYRRQRLSEPTRSPFTGGTYLISGGLGAIGLALAARLASEPGVALALVSRNGLDPNPDSGQARAVAELAQAGARVRCYSADVADAVAMAAVMDQAESELGPIVGVIHAAGVSDTHVIQRKSRAEAAKVLAAKVEGTRVLIQLLAGRQAEFLLLCSSLATVLGGPGQAAYCAANTFMESLAGQRMGRTRVIALSLDNWSEGGMANRVEVPAELVDWQRERLARLGLTAAEGGAILARVLAQPCDHVLVSSHDLQQRLDSRLVTVTDEMRLYLERHQRSLTRHPRPNLANPYKAPGNPLERMLTTTAAEVLGYDQVGVDDNFFDLGGDSLKGVAWANKLEANLAEVIHLEAIFENPQASSLGRYLSQNYPQSTATRYQVGSAAKSTEPAKTRLDEATLARVCALAPSLRPGPAPARKNPPALFILAPPRSGSTLLRVMLAGNPAFFAPPEALLLSFHTLGERAAAFDGPQRFWLEGATVALMSASGLSAQEAEARVQALEAQNLPVADFYGLLQQASGRLLVDKTPSYAFDPQVLAQAETLFDQPYYIHLQRHPYAMIHSYVSARMDLQLRHRLSEAVDLDAATLAELTWTASHRHIRDHLRQVPPERQLSLRFEDMVADPETEMRRICQMVGLPFDPGMLSPYAPEGDRMTQGVHAESRMLGDVKFNKHSQINPNVADAWRERYQEDFLADFTLQLAAEWGYDPIAARPKPQADPGDDPLAGLSEAEMDAMLALMEEGS